MDKIKIEEIIKKYAPLVRTMAKKYFIVGGSEDDLFQEGMIGLFQGIYDYDKTRGEIFSESFKKFVLMCAKRQMLDAIKQANRKKNRPLSNYLSFDKNLDNLAELSGTNLDPEKLLLDQEELEEASKSINIAFSKLEKEVLDLYLEGKTQSRIAQILDKPVKSIDNTLQRVKNKLKGK